MDYDNPSDYFAFTLPKKVLQGSYFDLKISGIWLEGGRDLKMRFFKLTSKCVAD